MCSIPKLVLGDIIHQAQGAFVASRSIVHNVLLCQDIVKHYSMKYCLPNALLKIDLRKAYDTMDWPFIKDMLVALRFPSHFIKIVMSCITSTSYSLVLNGNPMEPFKAQTGLQQGDPLSPYLVWGCNTFKESLLMLENPKILCFTHNANPPN